MSIDFSKKTRHPFHDGRDGDKSGAVAGESHALVNRVAGPFMSSASSSSTVAEVAVRSCVHAGKVFFSVCFTGGQGYRGEKRNVARGCGFEARVLSCGECEIEWECDRKLHRIERQTVVKYSDGSVLWRSKTRMDY
ncbi:hypothetical protein ALC62_09405 [Cyphomyrmex costatus]|uniref:Uncharacterized protein n=1 Tax=Cyphomyrmex costatus TaxID=456900 RepID=A0A195CGE4_9HYME|nr:hypothetical protein ALC62_09405 [Cyphomyrmex costatus]